VRRQLGERPVRGLEHVRPVVVHEARVVAEPVLGEEVEGPLARLPARRAVALGPDAHPLERLEAALAEALGEAGEAAGPWRDRGIDVPRIADCFHLIAGTSTGGLLDGTPVGAALDTVVSAVSQAVPLPVDIGLSAPGVTGPITAPLSVSAQLPAGQSVTVQVPPALGSVLGSVLQPVSALLTAAGDAPAPPGLSGLTAGH